MQQKLQSILDSKKFICALLQELTMLKNEVYKEAVFCLHLHVKGLKYAQFKEIRKKRFLTSCNASQQAVRLEENISAFSDHSYMNPIWKTSLFITLLNHLLTLF